MSDPEALASGPQEIVLSDRKQAPPVVKVAVADAEKKRAASAASAPVETAAAQPGPTTVAAIPAPVKQSSGVMGGLTGGAKNVQKWLHLGGQEPAPLSVAAAPEPDQPVSPAVLPPRRDDVHLASLRTHPAPPARANGAETQADARQIRRNSAGLAGETRRRVSPIRPERREIRRSASSSVRERTRWHDDRGAFARPH